MYNCRWYLRNRGTTETNIDVHILSTGESNRITVQDGGTLVINGVKQSDSGTYICEASNSEGTQQVEIHLDVNGALAVRIQPNLQTVNIGKSTDLVFIHYYRLI